MPLRSPFTIALLLMAGGAAIAKPVAITPAATPFTVGSLKLFALRDMTNIVANDGKTFGTNTTPAAVAAVLARAGARTDQLALGVDALLVRMPGHVVLIDTGLGPKVGGVLQQSLALARVTPDQVTDILITHSHGDHVGGLLTSAGGLAFPNATIRMSTAEWSSLRAHGDTALAQAIAAKVAPFAPGGPVLTGIRSVALAGHTPGHSGYQLTSGTRRLIAIGDIAHSAIVSLARPDWTIQYDGDPAAAEATRRAELARLAADHMLIFSPHFPYPGVGRIVAEGTGYVFRPSLK